MKILIPLIAAATIFIASTPASAEVNYDVFVTPQGFVAHVGNSDGRMVPLPPPAPRHCYYHHIAPTKQQQKLHKKQIKEYKKYVKKQHKIAKKIRKT